jgi:hypothetical protein
MDVLAAVMIGSVLTRPRAGMDGPLVAGPASSCAEPTHCWCILPDAEPDAPA